MAVLENSVFVEATPARVWDVLGTLDLLERYDPGIAESRVMSAGRSGVGAARHCRLTPGGWFRERVTLWEPARELAFELYECTLPVKRLVHRYQLVPEGAGTRVTQKMEYQLKFGPIGALLDALMVRRKWDQGIKVFLSGLKKYAEDRGA